MILDWTSFALSDALEIKNFYLQTSKSSVVANNIMEGLTKEVDRLIDNPSLASIEPLLNELPKAYRSLVVNKHYKVVYFADGDIIYIYAIWDCRKNPKTLVNSFKKNIKK